jgi:hypothetical protein
VRATRPRAASATTAASPGKPCRSAEPRRVSQRSPTNQTPGAGEAVCSRRGSPSASSNSGPSHEVAGEAGGPDDGAHLAQVELRRGLHADRRFGVVGLGRRRVETAATDDVVDDRPDPPGEAVAGRHVRLDAVVERDSLAGDADRAAHKGDARPGQRPEIQAAATRRHYRLRGMHGRGVRELAGPLVEEPGLGQPVDRVTSAIRRRQPADGARCQDDAPPGRHQVLGDLTARLRAANDQHGAVGQPVGVAVVGGVQLLDRSWERPCDGRDPRHVLVARGDDDGARPHLGVTRTHGVSVAHPR